MKIDYLHIKSNFKNLKGLKIDFDESRLMTVIVGKNGSGKSNVLEALAAIFERLDLGEHPPFSYRLQYKIGAGIERRWIDIDANIKRGKSKKPYIIEISDKNKNKNYVNAIDSGRYEIPIKGNITINQFKRNRATGKAEYLPKHIFAYYSGPSNRLEQYFLKHRKIFYKKLLYKKSSLKGDIRPLFYAKPFHSQFVLLAFFLNNTDFEKEFLNEHLGIKKMDCVHFVMRQPEWGEASKDLFWGARGVVRDFLELLFKHSLAPVKVSKNEKNELTGVGKGKNIEYFHLFLPNLTALKRFTEDLSPDELFKMLESTLLSEVLSEVNIRVILKTSKTPVTFKELSEGEQQLLTVLGLLKFTGGKDSLFLLDEPDTHLNPLWSTQYLKFLKDFVPDNEVSQLLMVTHHPLTIAGLQKEQIQVIKNDGNKIEAKTPSKSPRGMGISGVLKSDIFGLETTLDINTVNDIKERDMMVFKSLKTRLEPNEVERLDSLKNKLSKLGFNFQHKDPLYQKFMEQQFEIRKTPTASLLSPVEMEEIQQTIKNFLTKEVASERKNILQKTFQLDNHESKD